MILLWLLLLASPVYAHDFYSRECCEGRHCHRVPDGMVTENGRYIMVPGFTPVPKVSPKVRNSEDQSDHICTSDDGTLLYCVYRAQRGM